MNQDQIKQNVLSGHTWLRLLFMVGYAVGIWLTLLVLVVMVLAQVVIVLLTSTPNPYLQASGLRAGAYLFELVQFLLYNSDDKPFPFAPFPDPEADHDFHDEHCDHDTAHSSATAGSAPAAKPAPEAPSASDIPTLDAHEPQDSDKDQPR